MIAAAAAKKAGPDIAATCAGGALISCAGIDPPGRRLAARRLPTG